MEAAAVLRRKLARFHTLVRFALVGRAIGKLLAAALLLALVSFILDRGLRLPQAERAALLAAFGAVVVWRTIVELILPLARRLPEMDLALELERHWRGRGDLLASALQFSTPQRPADGTSAELRRQVVLSAESVAAQVRPAEVINWRPVTRSLTLGVLCLLFAGALVVFQPGTAALWVRRNMLLGDVDWPRRTQLRLLEFSGAARVVPEGEDVTISVQAAGVLPQLAMLKVRELATGRSQTLMMNRQGADRFDAVLPSLRQSLAFTVKAGDGVVPEHTVRVVQRPRVAGAEVRVRPPDYIGLGEQVLTWNAPALKVPAGSTALFRLRATKPLASGTVSIADAQAAPMTVADARTAEFARAVDRSAHYAFMLTDMDGVSMASPLVLSVEAVKDQPPQVSLNPVGVGERVTASARLPLRVMGADDYGLTRMWLEYTLSTGTDLDEKAPAAERVEMFAAVRPRRSVSAQTVVELADKELPLGGRVTCAAFGVDACTVPAPNTGRGEPLVFRIVSPQELLAALLIRQQDARQDVEDQIERERALIERARKAFESQEVPQGTWAKLSDEQRSAEPVLRSCAEAYGRVLEEMLNNRVVSQPAYAGYEAGIVGPLSDLIPAGGPTSVASAGLATAAPGGGAARGEKTIAAMADIVRTLETVRTRMLLLETYNQVIVAVEEIRGKQKDLLESTRKRYDELIRKLFEEPPPR